MTLSVPQIIDANINRVSEGLRVVEEYLRFVLSDKPLTIALQSVRKQLNLSETNKTDHILARETGRDARAKDKIRKRQDIKSLLEANFKRVEEGLRVLEEYTGNQLYNHLRYTVYELEKAVILRAIKKRVKNGIYLISDNVDVLEYGLKEGVSLIQLRDKACSKEAAYNKAFVLKQLAVEYDTPFIVNDYLDIAKAVDADGFHSGQDDLSVTIQRQIFGEHKIIGKTTHNITQGLAAQKQGADYVSVGPIWDTPSKPGRKGIGFDYLEQAASKLHVDFVAIGGVNLETVKGVLSYKPPLIGLIRDYKNISKIKSLL